MADINITFETLFDLLRREKSKEELQELTPDFITDLQNYLAAKAELGDSKQLENVNKIIKELYEKREGKVLVVAMNRSRTGSDMVSMDQLLPAEKNLYDELVKLCDEQRVAFFSQIKSGKIQTAKEIKDIKVRFLTPMPQFMGRKLEKYGPFAENQIELLPPDIANILISKGRAEKAQ